MAPEFFFYFFYLYNSQFQKRGISLISLGNGAKCWIFFFEGAFAHFLPVFGSPQVLFFVPTRSIELKT